MPVPRREFVDASSFVIRQTLENPCRPRFCIDVVYLCRIDKCVVDGRGFSAADRSYEQIILPSKGRFPFILAMSGRFFDQC